MRLLNVQTRQLHDFFHLGDPPPYAILSYTWDSTEVTLRDIKNNTAPSHLDYRKINYTSINSIFQWYGRSEVCYAFLPNVVAIDDQLWDLVKDGHLEDDEHEIFYSSHFTRSRWFTLQELLAPKRIVFFGFNWVNLGTRNTLSRCISMIARILEHVLGVQTTNVWHSFSVADRMSWAATRETTQIEDTAYCLLGIFDANMPLRYGEAAKAFSRLQEEVI
ncbi:hypothetical protein V8E51_013054 [Hyaloscypha variabilis]